MRNFAPGLAVGFFLLASTGSAHADYDMSGKWMLVPDLDSRYANRLDLVQSSGSLTSASSYPWAGSVNETTGEFHLEFYYFGYGGLHTFDGLVSPDGRSLAGTMVYAVSDWDGCSSVDDGRLVSAVVIGSRCGNNELDPGEECDFGDAKDGDCCSSSCLLEPAGQSCPSDGTECTSDLCNGAGVCEHAPIDGSCVEPNGCGTGECGSGACVVTNPSPAGAPCERDGTVCSADVCDGAGACTAGERVDCGPCGACHREHGCVRPTRETSPCTYPDRPCVEQNATSVKLTLRSRENGRGNRFKLDFEIDPSREFPAEHLGDPTESTRLRICVYEKDGEIERPVLAAHVPPGGTCDGLDCWEGGSGSFRYRDKTASAYGISRIDAREWEGFRVRGSGGNLDLTAELPMTSTFVATLVAFEDYIWDARCWSHPVSAVRQSADSFRGRYLAE